MRFFIFLKIFERCIFAFRGSSMSLNPITSYIRWKACVYTFQKFEKNLKLGNFTRLRAFWLEETVKTQNNRYEEKPPKPLLEVAQLQNLKIFFFSYRVCKRLRPCFFYILFWLSENWSFFLKIWQFCLLLPTFTQNPIFTHKNGQK